MEDLLAQLLSEGSSLTLPWGVDYASVLVGALTGALWASRRDLDVGGCIVLGLITAYGGGIIRDLLLQKGGIYFTSHPDLIVLCAAVCAFAFYFRGVFRRLEAVVFFADTLSVALFALSGAAKAYSFDEGLVLTTIMGALTAVGGGALRDATAGEVPGIFRPSTYYAVAAFWGSATFSALAYARCPLPAAGIVAVLVVAALRYLSTYFDWRTSGGKDLTPAVARGVRALRDVLTGMARHSADAARGEGRKERSHPKGPGESAGQQPDSHAGNEKGVNESSADKKD